MLLLCAALVRLDAAEVIPPKPDRYFNDYAGVVSKSAAARFNEQLAQFERDTSNQIVVAVFRKMETDSDIADYTQRVAQSWGVGQKDRRNGAVLFVFVDDRKMFVQVGYGLEGAIPDATAFDITERHIKPRFRAQDYEGGLAQGIDLLQKAAVGEYKGDGLTNRERRSNESGSSGIGCFAAFIFFIIALIILSRLSRLNRRRGWGYSSFGGPYVGGWGSGSGGGGSSGSGFSGFGGGGGSFGGGGAGSSW